MLKPFNGNYTLTQGFGGNPASYARFGIKGHNGLDYGLPTGTEVVAPHSGKVVEATNDPSGYGNYLKIENEKEGSILAHLQKFLVKVGDTVTGGQVIALSNNTGNSTGPHLHFGYYLFPRNRQNGYAGFIDPLPHFVSNQMATITQQELDEIRLSRDTHYNDLQAANETIKNLNQTIKDKEEIIKMRHIEVSTLGSQLLGKDAEIESLSKQAKRVPKLEEQLAQAVNDRTICLNAQESQNKTIAQLRANSKDYTTAKAQILFSELLKALIEKRW